MNDWSRSNFDVDARKQRQYNNYGFIASPVFRPMLNEPADVTGYNPTALPQSGVQQLYLGSPRPRDAVVGDRSFDEWNAPDDSVSPKKAVPAAPEKDASGCIIVVCIVLLISVAAASALGTALGLSLNRPAQPNASPTRVAMVFQLIFDKPFDARLSNLGDLYTAEFTKNICMAINDTLRASQLGQSVETILLTYCTAIGYWSGSIKANMSLETLSTRNNDDTVTTTIGWLRNNINKTNGNFLASQNLITVNGALSTSGVSTSTTTGSNTSPTTVAAAAATTTATTLLANSITSSSTTTTPTNATTPSANATVQWTTPPSTTTRSVNATEPAVIATNETTPSGNAATPQWTTPPSTTTRSANATEPAIIAANETTPSGNAATPSENATAQWTTPPRTTALSVNATTW